MEVVERQFTSTPDVSDHDSTYALSCEIEERLERAARVVYISAFMSRDVFSVAAPLFRRQQGIVPKRRSVHFGVYNVRLLSTLDKLMRDRPRYMGELSTSINDALLAVNLNTVELVKLQSRQKQTGRETQVVILNRLRKRIHQVAKKRNCSMNQLVNSALLVFYSKGGESKLKKPAKGRGSSVHLYDTMSEAERRELHQMLAELSAMQTVPFEAEEPNGAYYECDRNLKATVKVTPDGERTPVEKLETSFEATRGKSPRKIAREEITT